MLPIETRARKTPVRALATVLRVGHDRLARTPENTAFVARPSKLYSPQKRFPYMHIACLQQIRI